MNRLLREPLLHFLLISVFIFALYELVAEDEIGERGLSIDIKAADIQQLREQWLQQSGEEASEQVLDTLVDSMVREEVLFREAMRFGLDENDTIVRRRLVQKMEFLSANISSLELPTEDELAGYYDSHRDSYAVGERRSFSHVYFSRDRRGDEVLQDASDLLEKIKREKLATRNQGWGDSFILQYDYNRLNSAQVARVFGEGFAGSLFSLEASGWHGPILSEYGAHLVFLTEIVAGAIPPLAKIRKRVEDDFMQDKLESLREDRYREMLQRYSVSIEGQSP